MSNLAEQKRYTYKDYLKWDGEIRYELIDGIAYAMASPSRLHQKISMEISGRLWQFLKGKTCEVYHAPFDVRLNADTFDDIVVQPDILVVCDESKIDNKGIRGVPDLIIEILSSSNTKHDTKTKFILYQRVGVKEYWIIDPAIKTVQVYILKNGRYGVGSIYHSDDIIPIHTLKGCVINLSDVFYHTIDIDDIEDERESEINNEIIQALKASGVSDEQIEKAIKMLDKN